MCFSLASMPSIQQQPVFFAGGRQRTAFGRHVLPRAREELAAGSIGLSQKLDRWVSMHERPDRSRQRDAPGPFTCSSGGNTRGVLDATDAFGIGGKFATVIFVAEGDVAKAAKALGA